MECKICYKKEEEINLYAIPEMGIICEECLDKISRINMKLQEKKVENFEKSI